MGTVELVIKHICKTLYTTTGFSIVMAILCGFLFLFIEQNGLKKTVGLFVDRVRKDNRFRINLLFFFYLSMVLTRTLLNRDMWMNPVAHVLGIWTMHDENGKLYTENIENMILFAPLIFLMFCSMERIIFKKKTTFIRCAFKAVVYSFAASCTIEMLQLLLRCGEFQITDIVFNTAGGIAGGLIYWCVSIFVHHRGEQNE